MEIGIHTFGELVPDPQTRRTSGAQERLKQVIQMAVLAEEAGLALFGFGEHHRLDFAASAPPVVLAAVAQATKRIRLASTATVLSTADPGGAEGSRCAIGFMHDLESLQPLSFRLPRVPPTFTIRSEVGPGESAGGPAQPAARDQNPPPTR